MKKILIPLFLILLLCGCDARNRGITHISALAPPYEAAHNQQPGLYAPGSELERRTSGAVQTFVLPIEDAYGIRMVGNDILVFSGTEASTLTLLQGDSLQPKAEITLAFFLDHWDPSVRISGNTISYYDPVRSETVITNTALEPVSRFSLPDSLWGTPIFSAECSTIFYSTRDALYAWDLASGRHRLLRSTKETVLLTGLHSDGAILQCCSGEAAELKTSFLSTDTGKLLHTLTGTIHLQTLGAQYYGVRSGKAPSTLVFGTAGVKPEVWKPLEPHGLCRFLPQSHSALTVSMPGSGHIYLDHYTLGTGLRTASLELSEEQMPIDFDSSRKYVFLLCEDAQYNSLVLYRWDPYAVLSQDPQVYIQPHYTAENPDLQGLSQCHAYAAALSEKYGLQILLWKDAVQVQPWDYDLEPEYAADTLMDRLQDLDTCLSHYPEDMLAQTAAHFSSLNICLVRSITGTPESGSRDPATGIQFLQGTDAYVVIALGDFFDRSVYHELFHVMETHIYGNSIALDQWNELNPSGFSYDYSYINNKTRQSGVYLHHDTRSFVDTYSMSFPREDRARIMEYAMMPGNRELFQAESLQRKLQALCRGIREAYGLEKSQETYLWEQYLE